MAGFTKKTANAGTKTTTEVSASSKTATQAKTGAKTRKTVSVKKPSYKFCSNRRASMASVLAMCMEIAKGKQTRG